MKKLSEKKKRKEARKAANAIIERFLQKYGSCVIVNSKGEPLSLNVSKLASIYTQFFPTVYQEDTKFYFQYSKRGVWVKTSLLQITKQLKKILHNLYPDFYSEGSSGKSVACDVLYHLAGGKEQVSSVALRDLSNNFQRSQMYRKLVNISTENEGKFNSQALKAASLFSIIKTDKSECQTDIIY